MSIVSYEGVNDIARLMLTVPDPGVAYNEWPNPPWNTVRYEWNAEYPPCSPEWFVQRTAKHAFVTGMQYAEHSEPAQDTPAQVVAVPATSEPTQAEPEMQVHNGVVTDTHLFIMRDGKLSKKRLPAPIAHVGDLLQLCLITGLDALWIVPETELSDRATHDFIESPEGARDWEIKTPVYTKPGMYEDNKARCTFLKAWKKKNARAADESGREVHLGYAEHNNRWDLDTVTNPVHLLGALTYLEDALQYPVRYSPASEGKNLMIEENKKERAPWVRPVKVSKYPPVESTRVIDVLWKRALTASELELSHMIAADKNSQFPASGTSVLLGAGDPVYEEFPTFNMKKLRAGVYHCHNITSHGSEFDGVQLPHPTDGLTEGWFWTYTVKLLYELGYTFSITEAYSWDEAHTTLRPWAERVWHARAILDDKNPLCNFARYKSPEARKLAYNAVKPVLNMSIGLLAHPPEHANYPGALDWYRPDWNALIIDNARYQMFWRIRSFIEKGYKPVGVLADCLYYIVNTDNHIAALPKMFDRWDKLGGYKRKFKREITVAQAAPLFNDPKLDIGQINKMLLDYDRYLIEL